MCLSPQDAELFYRLHKALMWFVNHHLQLVKAPASSSEQFPAFPFEQRIKLREALLEHMDLIDAFVGENPYDFPQADLDIIQSWKDLVAGEFIVFRFLKKYTIFLTMKEPVVAYGVLALSDPFEDVIGPELPRMFKTILLPFKDQIVYDGILAGYNVSFGSGYRRSFKESYNQAKKRFGIVTRLPFRPETAQKSREPRPRHKKTGSKARSSILGRWRITETTECAPELTDPEVEGSLEFKPGRNGEFEFGHVHGTLDYRTSEWHDQPAVEFSWEGTARMNPAHGRGWAVLDGDEIEGTFFIHGGEEAHFRAVRGGAKPSKERS
jgi:hypothetical protein